MTVTSIASPPLADVLGAVLRTSDDTGAELITKELGRRFGAGGTTAAGVAVIRDDLAADGLPVSLLHAVDGSGLDRSDRATCPLIVAALTRAGPTSDLAVHPAGGGQVRHLVPSHGQHPRRRPGHRQDRHPRRRVRPQWLRPPPGRSPCPSDPPSPPPPPTPPNPAPRARPAPHRPRPALQRPRPSAPTTPTSAPPTTPAPPAGPVYSRSPLVFSLIQNGVANSTGVAIGDQIGVALAAYPSGPDPSTLGPLPVTPAR